MPELKTLHRAGLATDGWARFKAVLDQYLFGVFGTAITTPSTPPEPGQSLTIDGAGNAVWTYPSTSVNLWDTPPADPDPFNDEFDEGSPILADRGWTITNATAPATVYTYMGEVDYDIDPGSDMANGQYRASIVNGKLRIQFGGNVANSITKAGAIATGAATYVARMQQSATTSSPASAGFCGIFMINDPAVSYQGAANAAIINELYDATARFITYQAGALTTQLSLIDAPQSRMGSIFVTDWRGSGTLATMLQIMDSGATRLSLFNQSLSAGPFAPTAAGVYARNAVNNPVVGPQYLEIDYIRRYPPAYYPG